MFENFSKKQKIAIVAAALVFVALIAYAAATLVYRSGKVAVETKFAPFTATVTLNGEKINNNATNYIKSGTYELSVTLDHFRTISRSVTISESEKYLVAGLVSSDDEGKKIASDHAKDYSAVEALSGKIANDAGDKKIKSYPILQYLPINRMLYSISYKTGDNGVPIINIRADKIYRDAAVAKLYELDKNLSPADYNIQFTDYKDPFADEFSENKSSDPTAFIKNGYPKLIEKYKITNTKSEGKYFLAVLRESSSIKSGFNESYRILLEQKDDSWQQINTPYPVVSQYNASVAPVSILDSLNRM